jgi:hypothetical protein
MGGEGSGVGSKGDQLKPYLRIIGDIHGYIEIYQRLVQPVEYSVQLGDMGWGGEPKKFFETLNQIDASRHRIVAGNHDDYGQMSAHFLGDYGSYSIPLHEGMFEFFFIRGAYSVDRAMRLPGLSWWDNEQLTWEQGWSCLDVYREVKPRTVFTHDCPEEICYLLGVHTRTDWGGFRPTVTHRILQSCFEVHKPELWVFGHHHKRFREEYKGTTFLCLDGEIPGKVGSMGQVFREPHFASYIDFDQDGHLLTRFPMQRI